MVKSWVPGKVFAFLVKLTEHLEKEQSRVVVPRVHEENLRPGT